MQCDRGDHAIDEPARGHTPAAARPVHPRRTLEVRRRLGGDPPERREQPTQIGPAPFVLGTGEDLHEDRLGDRDVTAGCDELGQTPIGGRIGGAVELDPGRGLDEDHGEPSSAGISPIAPTPLMASASSVVIGRPAR